MFRVQRAGMESGVQRVKIPFSAAAFTVSPQPRARIVFDHVNETPSEQLWQQP